jgi:hypothetical protein
MKKTLFGLLIATVMFFGGVFGGVLSAGVFRTEQKPLPKPLFEKEIVNVPLFETAPINQAPPTIEPEKIEIVTNIDNSYIYGWYSLEIYDKMPEVNMILVYRYVIDDDGTDSAKTVLNTGIYTTLSDDIDEGFAEGIGATLKDNELKFKTKKLKGIEYRFEGTFFKNKTSGENGEKVLRGTLRKFVKGKKIAEVSGDFAYYEPFCLR